MEFKFTMLRLAMQLYPGEIILDPEDYERFKNCSIRKRSDGYVEINIANKYYPLHRAVLGVDGMVDHKNGVEWDCRKENLRPCDYYQNTANRPMPSNNTSGYKGITWQHGKWHARITHKGKRYSLGAFLTKEAAHEAYCKKSLELNGEFAHFLRG